MKDTKVCSRSWSWVMPIGLTAVAASLALSACGSSSKSSSSGSGSSSSSGSSTQASAQTSSNPRAAVNAKGMHVAFIELALGNTYNTAGQEGAEAQAKADGATITPFDGKFSPTVQVQDCQDAASSGRYKAIVLAPGTGPATVPCAVAAKNAHIPLTAWAGSIGSDNSHVDAVQPGVTSQSIVPLDTVESALATEAAAACAGLNPCRIVDLDVAQEVPSVDGAFQTDLAQEVKQHPNMQIVSKVDGGVDAGSGQSAMQDALAKVPKFNVLVSDGAQSQEGAMITLKSAHRAVGIGKNQVRVVGQGGTAEQIGWVRSGEMWGTIVLLPYSAGAIATNLAIKAALGQSVPKGVDPNTAANAPLIFDLKNKNKYPKLKGEWPQ